MTDEQINAAIAKACGWKHVRSYHWKNPNGLSMFEWDIFDYCNDLNAMHEAEKVLTEINWFTYISELAQIVRLPKQPEVQIKQSIHATARHRAEAFLRTLGKWRATDKESLTVGGATTKECSVDQEEVQK